jgi:hypothetical protein
MPHLEVDGISLSSGDIQGNGEFKPFKIDIKLLNTGKGVAAINDARLVIQKFVTVPLCNSQGDFVSTGTYHTNMPTDAKPGQVINVAVSQLVQPNGGDRFDVLLRTPLLQGRAKFNAYLYRVHLYLIYNVHANPLDVGEILVDLPFPPAAGEYYLNSYFLTHPQLIRNTVYAAGLPEYKRCAVKNSRALRSILSSRAMRPASLTGVLPQLRYAFDW